MNTVADDGVITLGDDVGDGHSLFSATMLPTGEGRQINWDEGVKFDGMFHGVAGTFECTGGDCSATNNADGELETLGGAWTFTPDNKDAMVAGVLTDTDFLDFGFWVRTNNSGDSVVYAVDGFFRGEDPRASVTDVVGTAKYKGGAAGLYTKREFAALEDDGEVTAAGRFTATAEFTANFGDDPKVGTESRRISGTMPAGRRRTGWGTRREVVKACSWRGPSRVAPPRAAAPGTARSSAAPKTIHPPGLPASSPLGSATAIWSVPSERSSRTTRVSERGGREPRSHQRSTREGGASARRPRSLGVRAATPCPARGLVIQVFTAVLPARPLQRTTQDVDSLPRVTLLRSRARSRGRPVHVGGNVIHVRHAEGHKKARLRGSGLIPARSPCGGAIAGDLAAVSLFVRASLHQGLP